MKQKLVVSLESPQHGFMSLRLSGPTESFVAVVSHEPYDSLPALIQALSAALSGEGEVNVRWNSEPEEYDFNFAADDDSLLLTIVRYPDHRRLHETSSIVFRFRGSKLDVCFPFWKELRDLQTRTVQDEFHRQWRREFPERELEELSSKMLGS